MKTEELDQRAIDPGPDKIIAPGFDYGTVTDKIANTVLMPVEKTPPQWWISLLVALIGACLFIGVGRTVAAARNA